MTEILYPGLYEGLPEDEYHADPVPGGSLSVSGAKLLLPPNVPALYHYRRTHPEKKDAFDYGTAAHSLVLEGEEAYAARVKVLDYPNWQSKASQAAKAAAEADGFVVILPKDDVMVRDMARALLDHETAMQLLGHADRKSEVSLFRQDGDTDVWLRSRLDILIAEEGVIGDYKTTTSCDPGHFARDAAKYRYHMQQAWYEDMAVELGIVWGHPRFRFIAQEKKPPYLVNVIELDRAAVEAGRTLNRTAIGIYSQCAAFGEWPGYRGTITVSLPEWAQYEADVA